MNDLVIAAGPGALEHIRKNGLSPDDICAIFGASGAAKWLAIAGIDHKSVRPIHDKTNRQDTS